MRCVVNDEKAVVSATGETGAKRKKEERCNWNKFSLKFFGDVLPDSAIEFPHTLDGALSMMRKMRQLVKECNDGKGKPLTYVMFPLSSVAFQNYVAVTKLTGRTVRNLQEGGIIQVIKMFDHITELRQKVHDQVDELNDHSRCVTLSELRQTRSLENSFEVQPPAARSEVISLFEKVHSADSDSRCS